MPFCIHLTIIFPNLFNKVFMSLVFILCFSCIEVYLKLAKKKCEILGLVISVTKTPLLPYFEKYELKIVWMKCTFKVDMQARSGKKLLCNAYFMSLNFFRTINSIFSFFKDHYCPCCPFSSRLAFPFSSKSSFPKFQISRTMTTASLGNREWKEEEKPLSAI